jgi:hypothetical protein
MQPWQSVLLIIITLLVFGAGFYYDQIKKDNAIGYENSLITSSEQTITSNNTDSILPELQTSKNLENSSAWAETSVIIEIPPNNAPLSYLHKEAIKGKNFLSVIVETLNKNPTAKDLIFSPFINEFFSEPESVILQSLYSIAQDTESTNQFLLIVRGHSAKASSLLTKVIIDTYKKELEQETTNNPLVPKLSKQRDKIKILEGNQLHLAKQIQEENENSSSQSVEEIAIRSELIQTTSEINVQVVALEEIEKIHLNRKDPVEYLTIPALASFGNVEEFLSNIDQLKKMLVDRKLESILKKEVTKNINKLEASLSQELASGIDDIKVRSRTALKRKIELQKRLVDLEMKKNDIHSFHPRFQLLKSVKSQLDEKRAIFSVDFKKWQNVKQGVIFTILP